MNAFNWKANPKPTRIFKDLGTLNLMYNLSVAQGGNELVNLGMGL